MKFSLDIIICTYNNAPMLSRTLEALSKQRVDSAIEWNVLVVNNNCIDDTDEIVSSFAQSVNFPVRLVHEQQQGLTVARVCGVKNSSADWLAFVDDDCLLEDDWLEQALHFISAHPECAAFGGKIILEWESTPPGFALRRPYAFAGKNLGENEC